MNKQLDVLIAYEKPVVCLWYNQAVAAKQLASEATAAAASAGSSAISLHTKATLVMYMVATDWLNGSLGIL